MDISNGELIEVISSDGWKKILQFNNNQRLQLQGGYVNPEEILKVSEGDQVTSSDGLKYYIFKPTVYDYIMFSLKRKTQIVYPKEAGYILLKLDIRNGKVIGEAGTGSGSLTLVFSQIVGEAGRVITFETSQEFSKNARENVEKFSNAKNVTFVNSDVGKSTLENYFDAFFMDLKEPWFYFERVYKSLKSGGNFGLIVPTTNQITQSINELEANGFIIDEIVEILHRKYKNNPNRLRPEDIMVGHTGYLLFAKKISLKIT